MNVYEPVRITVEREEMLKVAANLAWLRGYLKGIGEDEAIPPRTLAALAKIDEWAGLTQ
jgi:hypothetical protein